MSVGASTPDRRAPICSICLAPMEEAVCTTTCKHTFHTRCLLCAIRRDVRCPLCRVPLINTPIATAPLAPRDPIVASESRAGARRRRVRRTQVDHESPHVETEAQPPVPTTRSEGRIWCFRRPR